MVPEEDLPDLFMKPQISAISCSFDLELVYPLGVPLTTPKRPAKLAFFFW
jgi:hypothetical protein